MNARILDGKTVKLALLPKLVEKIQALSFRPTLAIIQVGDRADSSSYIKSKNILAEKIGVNIKNIHLPENILPEKIIEIINECNVDSNITGIIVQLPLPSHVNKRQVIDSINPQKDVDALTSKSVAKWSQGQGILPATARGVLELLNFYDIQLSGKKVAVIGRSELVGQPIAVMCRNKEAEVIVCHSQTSDLASQTRKADIIICAVGKAGLIQAQHVKSGQVVIDIGINRLADGQLVGDVNFSVVKEIVGAITPVPGGVGQMTVLALFENLVELANN